MTLGGRRSGQGPGEKKFAQKFRMFDHFFLLGPWPLWRPPKAAFSTSATSIGYQILPQDLSFHMLLCLLLKNEIGRS